MPEYVVMVIPIITFFSTITDRSAKKKSLTVHGKHAGITQVMDPGGC